MRTNQRGDETAEGASLEMNCWRTCLRAAHRRQCGFRPNKGFANEDEYLEYRLLNDPRFHRIVERSRKEARKGKVTKLDDLG